MTDAIRRRWAFAVLLARGVRARKFTARGAVAFYLNCDFKGPR